MGAALAYVNGGDPTAGGSAAVASEAAATYLANRYNDGKTAINPQTGEFDPNLLPEGAKTQIRDLTAAIGAVVGGTVGDSAFEAQLAGVVGQNAVENNYLSLKDTKALLKDLNTAETESDKEAVYEKYAQLSKEKSEEAKIACQNISSSACQQIMLDIQQGLNFIKDQDAVLTYKNNEMQVPETIDHTASDLEGLYLEISKFGPDNTEDYKYRTDVKFVESENLKDLAKYDNQTFEVGAGKGSSESSLVIADGARTVQSFMNDRVTDITDVRDNGDSGGMVVGAALSRPFLRMAEGAVNGGAGLVILGVDSDARAETWTDIKTFAEHPIDNTSTALTNYWNNTSWNEILEDGFVAGYGAGLGGGTKLVSTLDTSPIITVVDVPSKYGQAGQIGITLTPNPKLDVADTTKAVGIDQPQNPQGFYDPQGQRADLEAVYGAENVKSTTVVEDPIQRVNSNLEKGIEVIYDSYGNKAVKVEYKDPLTGEAKFANAAYDDRKLPIFDDYAKYTTKIEKPDDYELMPYNARRNAEMKLATLDLRDKINNG